MSLLLDAVLDQAANGSPATVMLSSESVAVLFFGSAFLSERGNWLDKAEDQLDEVTDADWDAIEKLVGNAAYELMTPLTILYPEDFYADAIEFELVSAAGVSRQVNTSALLCHYILPTPIAQFNSLGFRVFLRAGIYEFNALGLTSNNKGRMFMSINPSGGGGEIDWYSAATVANAFKQTEITVPTDGQHFIIMSMDLKNASSSNYDLAIEAVWGHRTGDLP